MAKSKKVEINNVNDLVEKMDIEKIQSIEPENIDTVEQGIVFVKPNPLVEKLAKKQQYKLPDPSKTYKPSDFPLVATPENSNLDGVEVSSDFLDKINSDIQNDDSPESEEFREILAKTKSSSHTTQNNSPKSKSKLLSTKSFGFSMIRLIKKQIKKAIKKAIKKY